MCVGGGVRIFFYLGGGGGSEIINPLKRRGVAGHILFCFWHMSEEVGQEMGSKFSFHKRMLPPPLPILIHFQFHYNTSVAVEIFLRSSSLVLRSFYKLFTSL